MSLTKKIYKLINIVLQSEQQKLYSNKYIKNDFKVVQYRDLNYGLHIATSMSILTLNLPNTKYPNLGMKLFYLHILHIYEIRLVYLGFIKTFWLHI